MNKIKKFVSNLLKDYFTDQDKKELIEILTTSLQEKVEDLVEAGTPVDEAIEKSIKEFGSTKDVLNAFPEKDQTYLTKYVRGRKHRFIFSVLGYLLILALALFFNLQFISFFGHIYWFIVIAIGTLFWPIAMFFRYRSSKK